MDRGGPRSGDGFRKCLGACPEDIFPLPRAPPDATGPILPTDPPSRPPAPKRSCIRYRARQPRASPVWQILHDHAAKLPGLSAATTAAIEAFLECGDLHAGFTRFHCPDCGHE